MQDAEDTVFAVNADRKGGAGPGLAFAQAMERSTGQPTGLLMCAKGGVGICAWERPGALYQEMIKRLEQASDSRTLAGVLIHVGEGDTRSSEAADEWATRFTDLVSNLRTDATAPSLPIVFAQIATISPERRSKRDHGYAGWDRLKTVQATISLPGVSMVVTDDLPLKSDGLHLTAAAQDTLGQRFAAEMLSLHNHSARAGA